MNSAAEQLSSGPGESVLEQRVRRLEAQMEAVIEAVAVLARGLENGPTAEPRDRRAEEAARRTHELLILAKSALPE